MAEYTYITNATDINIYIYYRCEISSSLFYVKLYEQTTNEFHLQLLQPNAKPKHFTDTGIQECASVPTKPSSYVTEKNIYPFW